MDKQIKDILGPLVEQIAYTTEKQAWILHLLAQNLPDLSEETKRQLLSSAQVDEQKVQTWRQALESFR